MQLSSNSNRAIELLIRSKPSHAGQYRQALLHRKDRSEALQFSLICEAKIKAQIELKEAELAIIERDITRAENTDELAKKYLESKLKIAEAELAELIFELRDLDLKRQDAEREIKTTEAEIQRIIKESGIDFDKLSDEQFQELMAKDTDLSYARRLAVQVLSSQLHLSPEACEMILELPDSDRFHILKETAAVLNRPEIQTLLTSGES